MADTSIPGYEERLKLVAEAFDKEYQAHGKMTSSRGQLPMTTHGWQMSLVDGKWYKSQEEIETIFLSKTIILTLMPNLPPGSFQTKYYAGWIYYHKYDEIPKDASIEAVLKVFELGELVAARPCPFPSDLGMYPPPEEGERQSLKRWATLWAREVADEHFAEANRTFRQAQETMTSVYFKLFELEHTLRIFIEHQFSSKFGKSWLSKASKNQDYQAIINRRRSEAKHAWLDDTSDSETRFLDFAHYRLLIHENQSLFDPLVPDIRGLKRLLEDIYYLRNRVAHMNTLSQDDSSEFMRMSERILAILRPHVSLR
jgi:hypothetical protein